MSEQVTLLDLSFNTGDATDGLDALIKKSLELAEKKTQLTKQINAEKAALAELRRSYNGNAADQTAYNKAVEKSTSTIVGLTKELNDNKSAYNHYAIRCRQCEGDACAACFKYESS